jgi:hypothetical protein
MEVVIEWILYPCQQSFTWWYTEQQLKQQLILKPRNQNAFAQLAAQKNCTQDSGRTVSAD